MVNIHHTILHDTNKTSEHPTVVKFVNGQTKCSICSCPRSNITVCTGMLEELASSSQHSWILKIIISVIMTGWGVGDTNQKSFLYILVNIMSLPKILIPFLASKIDHKSVTYGYIHPILAFGKIWVPPSLTFDQFNTVKVALICIICI